LSNAGSYYFEDRADLAQLDEINWEAVQADRWSGNGIDRSIKEGKQAEFLIENRFSEDDSPGRAALVELIHRYRPGYR
jgi:hypothetical protein